MIPIAGSAYTYTYATMGELIAWISLDLILEYAVSNMAVSVASPHTSLTFSTGLACIRIHAGFLRLFAQRLSDLQGNMLYGPAGISASIGRLHHRDDSHHDSGARHPRVRRNQ